MLSACINSLRNCSKPFQCSLMRYHNCSWFRQSTRRSPPATSHPICQGCRLLEHLTSKYNLYLERFTFHFWEANKDAPPWDLFSEKVEFMIHTGCGCKLLQLQLRAFISLVKYQLVDPLLILFEVFAGDHCEYRLLFDGCLDVSFDLHS